MSHSHGGIDGHGHRHGDGEGHLHGHSHRDALGRGVLARLRHLLRPHSHEAADKVDAAMEASAEGMRALWISVDPALVDRVEDSLRATPGVLDVGQVRLRWIGHQLRAECEVVADAGASAIQAHRVAVSAEHSLLQASPQLAAALVHTDPQARGDADYHAELVSHR